MKLDRKVLAGILFAFAFPIFTASLRADTATLVSTGAVWRFLDNGSNQGSTWQGNSFDDSGWKAGPAQLGYGEGDEATVVDFGPEPTNKFITTYFRRDFVITNNTMFTNLLFRLLRDDGAAVYLNGIRQLISNMPETFDYSTLAPAATCCTDETNYFAYNVLPSALVIGTNVVAVEVHQNHPASGDLSFDLELTGQFSLNNPPSVAITSPPGEQLLYSSNILISVAAFGGSGAISKVEIYANGARLVQLTTSPYHFNWTNSPAGTELLRAVATDSRGIAATSAPVRLFVLAPGAPWPMIIPTGSVWKYLDNGSDPGTAWRSVNFDDSAWASGRAQLGYGDGDEATLVSYGPDPAHKFITTYFRRTFALTNPRGYTNSYLRIMRDDGAIVYLNGVEIFRSNMAYSGTDSQSAALVAVGGAEESAYFYHRVNPQLFVNGSNVIAVEMHQSDPASSDLSFDFELTGNVTGPDTSFNLAPGQRGTVHCVNHPDIAYDLYLPPGYSSNGTPRPLLWTFHPNGNGMVSDFQSVASSLQMIVVGILESRNGMNSYDTIDVRFAVARDLRRRVNYDPTAMFASGWSGGAVDSFEQSKMIRQHLAGIFSMSGWLENRTGDFDRYLTNLLVSRANGNTDAAANYYLVPDGDYLRSWGVVIRDTMFSGGHVISPDSVKLDCLSWLLSQRIPAGPNDRTNAMTQAASWRSAIALGDRETMLRQCVNSIITKPRTYEAHYAQIVLDELLDDYPRFRRLTVTNLVSGLMAGDFFFHLIFGAATCGEQDYYKSCLKAAGGVTDTDRQPDYRSLMNQNGVPQPEFNYSSTGRVLRLTWFKDADWLEYTPIETTDLTSGAWMPISVSELNNSDGSFSVELPTGSNGQKFYRLSARNP